MPSVYDLKPAFQNLLRPPCRWLARIGVTPNQITLAALFLSLATGALLAWRAAHPGWFLLLPPVLLLRMALNALDGMLAREHRMQSRLGAILNELGDVLADAALYLPFALLPGVWPGLAVGVVVLAVISEMAGVVAVQIGASRRYDGPMGKSDRALALGAAGLLLGLGLTPGPWLNAGLAVILALLCLTVYFRCARALGEAAHV
jgi:CDP-diacylglycerol--glycerol-3-phosphate 3-phosphatidyltransferase